MYTAPSEQAALDRFAEFSDKWEKRYPAIIRLWTNAWAEFVPFLQFGACCRMRVVGTDRDARLGKFGYGQGISSGVA